MTLHLVFKSFNCDKKYINKLIFLVRFWTVVDVSQNNQSLFQTKNSDCVKYFSCCLMIQCFLMGHHRHLFRLFPSFQTNIIILTTNICEIFL